MVELVIERIGVMRSNIIRTTTSIYSTLWHNDVLYNVVPGPLTAAHAKDIFHSMIIYPVYTHNTSTGNTILVGGFNPFEKYVRQIGSSPPGIRGEHKKSLSCHHLDEYYHENY